MVYDLPKTHYHRKSFAKIQDYISVPDLIEVQKKSYDDFLQRVPTPSDRNNQGLHAIFAGEPIPEPPSLAEQGQVMAKHFELICRFYKPTSAVRYFRKFLVRYCRRHPMRKQVQQSFLAANDGTQLLAEIQKWYGNNHFAIGSS